MKTTGMPSREASELILTALMHPLSDEQMQRLEHGWDDLVRRYAAIPPSTPVAEQRRLHLKLRDCMGEERLLTRHGAGELEQTWKMMRLAVLEHEAQADSAQATPTMTLRDVQDVLRKLVDGQPVFPSSHELVEFMASPAYAFQWVRKLYRTVLLLTQGPAAEPMSPEFQSFLRAASPVMCRLMAALGTSSDVDEVRADRALLDASHETWHWLVANLPPEKVREAVEVVGRGMEAAMSFVIAREVASFRAQADNLEKDALVRNQHQDAPLHRRLAAHFRARAEALTPYTRLSGRTGWDTRTDKVVREGNAARALASAMDDFWTALRATMAKSFPAEYFEVRVCELNPYAGTVRLEVAPLARDSTAAGEGT